MAMDQRIRDRKPSEVGMTGLSVRAKKFVAAHPDLARIAVVAALEATAVQWARDKSAQTAMPDVLRKFVVQRTDILSVASAARRLDTSRTTVYDWVKKGILIGWSRTKRGLAIPEEQIVGPGQIAPGIPQVVKIIGGAEIAWSFLDQEWPFENETARPIEKLMRGDVEDVVGAASAFGASFT